MADLSRINHLSLPKLLSTNVDVVYTFKVHREDNRPTLANSQLFSACVRNSRKLG